MLCLLVIFMIVKVWMQAPKWILLKASPNYQLYRAQSLFWLRCKISPWWYIFRCMIWIREPIVGDTPPKDSTYYRRYVQVKWTKATSEKSHCLITPLSSHGKTGQFTMTSYILHLPHQIEELQGKDLWGNWKGKRGKTSYTIDCEKLCHSSATLNYSLSLYPKQGSTRFTNIQDVEFPTPLLYSELALCC